MIRLKTPEQRKSKTKIMIKRICLEITEQEVSQGWQGVWVGSDLRSAAAVWAYIRNRSCVTVSPERSLSSFTPTCACRRTQACSCSLTHLFFFSNHFVDFMLQRQVVSKKGPRGLCGLWLAKRKTRDRYQALFHNEEKNPQWQHH